MMIFGEGGLGRNRFSWSLDSRATNHGISVLKKKRGQSLLLPLPFPFLLIFSLVKTWEEGPSVLCGIQPSASITVSSSFLLLRTVVFHHPELLQDKIALACFGEDFPGAAGSTENGWEQHSIRTVRRHEGVGEDQSFHSVNTSQSSMLCTTSMF